MKQLLPLLLLLCLASNPACFANKKKSVQQPIPVTTTTVLVSQPKEQQNESHFWEDLLAVPLVIAALISGQKLP